MKLLRIERKRIIFLRSLPIIGSKVWYKIARLVFREKIVSIVQSGLKYDFSVVAAGLR